MSLQNIKNQKGFTIVELLIVIVVIGILAAIVIVAYNGVTQKANTSAAQGNAESVQKVAETMNADENINSYPYGANEAAVITSLEGGSDIAKMPSGVSIVDVSSDNTNVSTTPSKSTIGYKALGTTTSPTGGCVAYYDFNLKHVAFVGVGAATVTAATSSADGTCS